MQDTIRNSNRTIFNDSGYTLNYKTYVFHDIVSDKISPDIFDSITAEPTEKLATKPTTKATTKPTTMRPSITTVHLYDETVFIAVFTTLSGILFLLFLVHYRLYLQRRAKAKRKLGESFGVAYTLDNV